MKINENKYHSELDTIHCLVKRSKYQEICDELKPKELPFALKLIEVAQNEGATVKEFVEAMDRAKAIVFENQNVSLLPDKPVLGCISK